MSETKVRDFDWRLPICGAFGAVILRLPTLIWVTMPVLFLRLSPQGTKAYGWYPSICHWTNNASWAAVQ
jgi:hypothetical protein